MEIDTPTPTVPHNNNNNDDDDDTDLSLLDKLQSMVEVEQSLTATLEKVEPWLLKNTTTDIDPHRPRVRPIPQTMEQVNHILAVARNLASRTSAPAAWNPAAPVVGFSTPNPLPHQLRGGALAALQLDRARQAERDKKRRVVHQERTESKTSHSNINNKKPKKEEEAAAAAAAAPQHRAQAARRARVAGEAHARRNPQQQLTTMNLSDSSSSSDDDEEEEDEENSDSD